MKCYSVFLRYISLLLTSILLLSISIVASASEAQSEGSNQIRNEMKSSNHTESPVVQICARNDCSLAVCEDGTVLYAGGTEEWRDSVSKWNGIEYVLDSIFARRKDGSYTSIYGETNLPVLDSPIAITKGSMGNWVALLSDGVLLCSSFPDRVDDFSSENETGYYGMSDYRFKEVVFGADSCYGLLPSGKVLPFAYGNVKDEIANWTEVKHLCFCDGYVPVALTENGRVLSVSTSEHVDTSEWMDVVKLLANCSLTVGLRSDGTVLATGGEYWSEPFADKLSGWTDIVDIAVNDNTWSVFNDGGTENAFIIGLKSDRTVVVAGDTSKAFIRKMQKKVSGWRDIVQISVGKNHVLGLKADGTVVAAGDNSFGQCDIGKSSFSMDEDFIEITQCGDTFFAVRKDGTVAAATIKRGEENNWSKQNRLLKEKIERWTNVKKIVALGYGDEIAVIKKDGSVIVEIFNEEERKRTEEYYNAEYYDANKECSSWSDIDDIVSNRVGTFGLKKDGTVIATAETIRLFEENYRRKFTFDGWKDIAEIQTSTNMNGDYVLFGLSKDGTLYYNGSSMFAGDWNGIVDISAIDCKGYIYFVLRKNGTVDIGGINCGAWIEDVYRWKDIVQIRAGESGVAGIKRDGTVVVAGYGYPEELKWDKIQTIYFDADNNLYGLCKDGTIKCCIRSDGYYSVDQYIIESWQGIENLSFLYDMENNEIVAVGIRNDGGIFSTHELSF